MEEVDTAEARRAVVGRVISAPPPVHPDAPNGAVWSTTRSCYDFMADHVHPGSRTLETGAGISTVLFAAWGCEHLAIVPFIDEVDAIRSYCSDKGIDITTVAFDIRPSEVALPELPDASEFDLVFIDGGHGFPLPVVDWFYGAGRLRRGGVVVFDDVQLPQVSSFLEMFMDRDDRWQPLQSTSKWRAYRRMSEGSLAEGEWTQSFFPVPKSSPWQKGVRTVKDAIPLAVRAKLARVLHW